MTNVRGETTKASVATPTRH